MGRVTVLILTVVLVAFAFIPVAQGYIVQVATLGYSSLMQMVLAVLGPLFWVRGTAKGAIASILTGGIMLITINIFGSPLPLQAGTTGLLLGSIVFVGVSLMTQDENEKS